MVNRGRLPHFTQAQQLDRQLVDELFERADRLRQRPSLSLTGKILVLEFYEPSTRTRHSFESAMLRLGGTYTSTENAEVFSSSVKGESYEDTARVISSYGDAIVVRSKETGVADRMAKVSSVPVINAGDGTGQHPTQALLDLYTIKLETGRLDKLKVVIVGDLAHGRTARSLAYLLAKCSLDVELVFVAPEGFGIGKDIKDHLTKHGKSFTEETDLNKVLGAGGVDVVYLTRLQKERMSDAEFEAAHGKLVFTEESLKLLLKGNPNAKVLHPLPKVDEVKLPINVEEDNPAIAYFRQSRNGVHIRAALLECILRD